MNHFQEYIGNIVLPGQVIDRIYGETCNNQRFCILTTRTIWYMVFVIIEIDENEKVYKKGKPMLLGLIP